MDIVTSLLKSQLQAKLADPSISDDERFVVESQLDEIDFDQATEDYVEQTYQQQLIDQNQQKQVESKQRVDRSNFEDASKPLVVF